MSSSQKNNSALPLFYGRTLAAPSWVMPCSLQENCQFLAGKVHEVGLLFLETKHSLCYTSKDLPPELAQLPISFHVHLPSDLEGKNGTNDALLCCELMDKVQFLGARNAVLHLPAINAIQYLERFMKQWIDSGRDSRSLLLENTKEQNLLLLENVIASVDAAICIDTGHALAYDHKDIFSRMELLERTQMVHLNAPGEGVKKSSHLPLTSLTPAEQNLVKSLLMNVPQSAIIMLELFQWKMIEMSLPMLEKWLEKGENS